MQPKDIRALQDAWSGITDYQLIPQELTETVEYAVEELWEECLLEETDLTEEQLEEVLVESAMEYIEEAKVTFGHDTKEPAKRYSDGSRVGATRRLVRKQIGSAVKRGKSKVAGAAVSAVAAGKMAKDKAGEVKKAVADAPGKAREAASDAKQKAKSGIKGFIKRQAQKVVSRMSEEVVDEALTGQRQMRARDMKGTPYQKGGGKRTARDNKTLHNLATRNEGPGTPGYEKKSTGGKGGRKYAGYGDQGAGNKARRRAGEQPMRGNRDPRKEEIELTSFKKIQEKLNLKKTQWGV